MRFYAIVSYVLLNSIASNQVIVCLYWFSSKAN